MAKVLFEGFLYVAVAVLPGAATYLQKTNALEAWQWVSLLGSAAVALKAFTSHTVADYHDSVQDKNAAAIVPDRVQ